MANNESVDIPGYQKMDEAHLALFVSVRELEIEMAARVQALLRTATERGYGSQTPRHAAIAQTHFETGFMFLGKAVTQPTTGFGAAVPGKEQ